MRPFTLAPFAVAVRPCARSPLPVRRCRSRSPTTPTPPPQNNPPKTPPHAHPPTPEKQAEKPTQNGGENRQKKHTPPTPKNGQADSKTAPKIRTAHPRARQIKRTLHAHAHSCAVAHFRAVVNRFFKNIFKKIFVKGVDNPKRRLYNNSDNTAHVITKKINTGKGKL